MGLKRWIFFIALAWVQVMSSCAHHGQSHTAVGKSNLVFKGKTFRDATIASLLNAKAGDAPVLIEFENCTFQGSTRFAGESGIYQVFPASAIFRSCTFEGKLSGSEVQFLGQLSFGKCLFKQDVNFQNASFFAPVGFKECTFDADAAFQHGLFLKEASWMGTHFYGIPLFQAGRFFERAQFQNVVFHGNSDFTLCRFMEGAVFDYCRAEGQIDFSESQHFGLMSFRKSEFLKIGRFEAIRSFAELRFTQATFRDSLYLHKSRFFAEKPDFSEVAGKLPKVD